MSLASSVKSTEEKIEQPSSVIGESGGELILDTIDIRLGAAEGRRWVVYENNEVGEEGVDAQLLNGTKD